MDRRDRPVSWTTGNLGDLQFLRAADVCALLRISRPTLWRMRRDRQFPLPTSLSPRSIGWRRVDVESWLETRAQSHYRIDVVERVTAAPMPPSPPRSAARPNGGNGKAPRAPRGRKQLPLSLR